MSPRKLITNYWYKTFIRYCPVCGREDKWRERQYTERPINQEDRMELSYDTSCPCIYI